MGKIIQFPSNNNNQNPNQEEKTEEKSSVKSFGLTDFEKNLREVLEDYIKSVFAVKEVLGMDIVYKENKNTVGVLGVIAYEHKRRPGTFVANFVSEVIKKPSELSVVEVAFEAGEPELYRSIFNTLKAKKALPEVKS